MTTEEEREQVRARSVEEFMRRVRDAHSVARDHEHHGLVVEAYPTERGWHVHVMACPDLDTRDQLMAASAIADAITDTQRTLLEQIAQQS